jgi:hypothetical protein
MKSSGASTNGRLCPFFLLSCAPDLNLEQTRLESIISIFDGLAKSPGAARVMMPYQVIATEDPLVSQFLRANNS